MASGQATGEEEEGRTISGHEHRPGILQSMLKSVGEAKEAFAVGGSETGGVSRERMEPAARAGDYADYAPAKTMQTGDAEKTEGVGRRMAELKETAAVAARRAVDVFTGKAEVIDRKALEGGDINVEKFGENEFVAREKMGEMTEVNEGGDGGGEAKQRAAAEWDTTAERGIAARKNIYGAMGSVTEAIKDKLIYPTDIVQEARASREHGGPKRGEKLVGDAGESPPEAEVKSNVFTAD